MKLSAETLRQLLSHNPATGELWWRPRGPEWFSNGKWSAEQQAKRWNTRYAGKEAFTSIDARGYGIGAVFNQPHSKHRVMWALHYGQWPTLQLDHINGERADNRIENLREVTNRQNSLNSAMKRNNTSGFSGVSRHRGRYRAQIKIDGKQFFLGYFDEAKDAHNAYCAAKMRSGFSERHGSKTEF